jgi:hypothetical protein
MQAILPGIVTYSASLHGYCGPAYQGSIAPRKTDIDGLPLYMQAVHCYPPIRAG